jgi:hypothetical protein
MLRNFFRKSYHVLDKVENGTAGRTTDENVTWRMRVACWVTKVTNTRSEYEYLLLFARQEMIHERVSMLRHTYIGHFV